MADATGHINPTALENSLNGVLEAVEGTALERALHDVLKAACVLFGISGTGLLVIDENRIQRYVASTDEIGRFLEEIQERSGVGPCVDALTFDTVVQSRDVGEDERWPEIRGELVERGIRAVLGVPVHIAGDAVGSLDGYVDQPYEWDDSDVTALQAYADLIGSLLASAVQARQRGELADQLQQALDSRVVIERAVGMIMGVDGLDAVTAFNRLRKAARDRRIKVAELAERILEGAPLDG